MTTETTAIRLGKPAMHDFYRCYILPPHIDKAKASGDKERQASLEAELKRRKASIAAAGLQDEYAAYVKAQAAKQAEWDTYAAIRTKHGKEGDKTLAAREKMLASREAFRAEFERF